MSKLKTWQQFVLIFLYFFAFNRLAKFFPAYKWWIFGLMIIGVVTFLLVARNRGKK
ncbi:hypothetical protein [Lactococcus termiticola]|uniref:Uncharacterized protein n=1 Tax=Lactococcus termiticola TaxID=2169526 RepID=A0A2R5HFY4_9LACT|nr:hypothetical protein [Lactococcus termiticola]GBG96746.1 hypothetical protein NtB2_00870 [Lactococcus termiticola]